MVLPPALAEGRPMGAGRILNLHLVGPRLTQASLTNSSSTSIVEDFCSALAIAERNTFSMGRAARLRELPRMLSASSTFLPRIRSMTRRAFCGEPLTYLALACTSMLPYRLPLTIVRGSVLLPYRIREALSVLVVCPLKVRVGANSPSLCPTMFSVM